MMVLTCDNRQERGQRLRFERPRPRVDMRSLLPRDRWPDMYRQDGMAELLDDDAIILDIGVPGAAVRLAESGAAAACLVVDHEAMDRAFADFWEADAVANFTRNVLQKGGFLWIGFQSSSYLPAWLATVLPGAAPVVDAGTADAFVPCAEHALTRGLPEAVDFICNRSWRALRNLPSTEPMDLTPQPSERGSLAWRTIGDGWRCLAHRQGHAGQAALAVGTAGGGTVVLDQTLAFFGANIDSAPARCLARNIRRFLDAHALNPSREGSRSVPGGLNGSQWQALMGPLPPEHAAREIVMANGIPFAVHGNESLLPCGTNRMEIPVGGAVRRLHLLGNILSYPMATGAWFTDAMDFREDFFIGDDVGRLTVEYADGSADVLPLIVGWTICWAPALLGLGAVSMKPFDAPDARATLFDVMALKPGAGEGVRSWVLSMAPRSQPIKRLVVEGDPDRPGVPVYGAITIESDQRDLGDPLPGPSLGTGGPCLALPCALPDGHLDPLRRLLYTTPADFAAAPLALPATFEGADIRFHGPREASAWTCIYAHNLASFDARLHPVGGGPHLNSGRVYGTYRQSLGTWQDGRCNLSGGMSFWSRDNGRAGVERVALGLHRGVDTELTWWDRMLYAAHPPHTRRAINEMLGPAQWNRRTLSGHSIHVAPENDGHGLLMLYHAAWLRHHPERLDALWPAMLDYAEWICFLMENPVTPDQPRHTLYTDSECSGYGHWDIYSNWLCLDGLRAYAEIAERAGYRAYAERWTAAAHRLAAGIRDGLVDPVDGRRIWHASPFSQWQSKTEALTPLFTLPDRCSYDIADADPDDVAVSRDTYARLVAPEYYHLRTRMIGYDHALLLQAAMLLDDGPRFERLLHTLAYAIYDKHAEETWIVAEGAVIPTHERFWHRLGMGANTIHVAETLKVARLLVGFDDLKPGHLKVMPRLPASWEGADVADYPLSGGCRGAYRYRRDRRYAELALELSAGRTVDIRLGPFAERPTHARVNGQAIRLDDGDCPETPSGYWGWVRNLEGTHANVKMAISGINGIGGTSERDEAGLYA